MFPLLGKFANGLRVDKRSEKSIYSPLAAACASFSDKLVLFAVVVFAAGVAICVSGVGCWDDLLAWSARTGGC